MFIYIFNVKANFNSRNSIYGIRNVAGGQLVQATDNHVGVLKSRIIFFDEGDLVRAGTTALWLKKMNFECYVFKGKEKKLRSLNFNHHIKLKSKSVNLITFQDLKMLENKSLFDIRKSTDFCKSRLKSSIWLNRANIEHYISKLTKNIVIISKILETFVLKVT